MLMKCTRGAEAISIFKPTDDPSTSFCLGWSGWCGEVWQGGVERAGRRFFSGGLRFFFPVSQSVSQSPASQSDCENRSLTERVRMVGDVNTRLPEKKQSRAPALPLCRYICLAPKSPYSTSQKVCHTSVGRLEREHK